ncbi:hypothetical protein L1049_019028 [Liquidambar formosana]|uniref:Uncharacterized protein n=1 Tax=Liquidambar formosana TaxID=63359 RepID=A0AAP0RAV3_LIQFO
MFLSFFHVFFGRRTVVLAFIINEGYELHSKWFHQRVSLFYEFSEFSYSTWTCLYDFLILWLQTFGILLVQACSIREATKLYWSGVVFACKQPPKSPVVQVCSHSRLY